MSLEWAVRDAGEGVPSHPMDGSDYSGDGLG